MGGLGVGHADIKSVIVTNATSKPVSRNPVPEKKEKTVCLFENRWGHQVSCEFFVLT